MRDHFSRYTWVNFIREKSDIFGVFENLCVKLRREKNCNIGKNCQNQKRSQSRIRKFHFCWDLLQTGDCSRFFSTKDSTAKWSSWKDFTLLETTRMMLNVKDLSHRFWAEAISAACYTINRVYLRPTTSKTPYELWKGRRPSLQCFYVFGSKCYIMNDKEH